MTVLENVRLRLDEFTERGKALCMAILALRT